MDKKVYSENFVSAAYNTVDNLFTLRDLVTEKDVPFEFISIVREALVRDGGDSVELKDITFPLNDEFPSYMRHMIATKVDGGWMLDSAIDDMGLSFKIPEEDERYGNFVDESNYFDVKRPTLPHALLSDEKLDFLNEEVRKKFGRISEKDRTTGIPLQEEEMNIPEGVRRDPLGADFTGQMRPVDE